MTADFAQLLALHGPRVHPKANEDPTFLADLAVLDDPQAVQVHRAQAHGDVHPRPVDQAHANAAHGGAVHVLEQAHDPKVDLAQQRILAFLVVEHHCTVNSVK